MTSITHISSALYRYLCQHVVGTEETVKTKRMLNNVHDRYKRHELLTFITSGSFGEGLEMKGSDLDTVIVMGIFNIYESFDFKYDPDKILNFILDTEGTEPGYTKLKSMYANGYLLEKFCIKTNSDFYLSNKKFKNLIKVGDILSKHIFHGPCISTKDLTVDFAFSVHSKTWITPASHWLERAHNQWPLHDVKIKVVDCGVLFVPIGVKGSDNEELEFRISFAAGEKLLIYSFNHTQLLCYALMKILLKDIIEQDSRCKSALCSYFIKTILLWVCEEQPLSVWTPENLIPCFIRCFQRLIYCVEYSICPHYFIPENNMFKNRIEGFVRQVLLENLNILYSDGWRCLLTSQQLSKFEPLTPLRIEFNSFQIYLNNIINSGALYRHRVLVPFCQCENNKMGMYGIEPSFRYKSPNIKPYHVYGISVLSFRKTQLIQITTRKGNKETYERYNTCLSYLLLNTHHDAVSGWLMLASFFYKMKQYRLALNIIFYSLSKFSPEKFLYQDNLMCGENWCRHTNAKKVLSHKIWKSMGVVRTIAILCLEPVYFTPSSQLIPSELEMLFKDCTNTITIHPEVFAYFLCFLCYYHIRDVRRYCSFLLDLDMTITDLNSVLSGQYKYYAYCVLGIALEVIRDYDSAREAFLKAVEIDTNNVFSFPLQRLSMMDKK